MASSRKPEGPAALRLGWPQALALGLPASAVAIALMLWARSAYQIRTLPERMMEWSLQFIPLDLFEQGLQKFGTSAKEFALIGNYVGLAATLVVIAAIALRRGPQTFAVVAGAMWLLAMAVIMPITGAGFFATNLSQDVILTNVSYLGVAVAFGTVVALVYTLVVATAASAAVGLAGASRRAFVGGAVGTVAAYGLTFWFGRDAGSSSSSLPLAKIGTASPPATPTASGGIAPAAAPAAVVATDTPVPSSAAVATPTADLGASPVPTTVPGTTPVPTATVPPLAASPTPTAGPAVIPPRPAPAQVVKRDKDGSLTASTRAAGQLQDEFTPGNGFYITTKNAGGDPVVDPAKWRLVLDGEVVNPVQLDLPILYQLPSVEMVKTLECISNWVNRCDEVPFGCGLIGNAKWKGVRLSDVINLAGGFKSGVAGIITMGVDEFSSYIPADAALMNDTILVYEMNGQVLPLEHGYPARLLVPGRYGLKSPKWVVGIRPTKTPYVDWYGRLGWNKDGFVQAMTRIDQPANGATLPAGPQPIAGIAYAGAKGVSKVEYSADGGQTWTAASFVEDPPGKDVWARWKGTFTLPAGATLTLAARLVDGTGKPQNTNYTITQPDGGTGLYTATVKAS